MTRDAGELTAFDRIAAVIAGLTTLGLATFPLVARSFAAVFRDLGARRRLDLDVRPGRVARVTRRRGHDRGRRGHGDDQRSERGSTERVRDGHGAGAENTSRLSRRSKYGASPHYGPSPASVR
jgi:hypothetical protein